MSLLNYISSASLFVSGLMYGAWRLPLAQPWWGLGVLIMLVLTLWIGVKATRSSRLRARRTRIPDTQRLNRD